MLRDITYRPWRKHEALVVAIWVEFCTLTLGGAIWGFISGK